MEKIALISDIHGNSYALNEVLNDINARNVDAVINLGDSLYGPLDPVGTYRLIRNADARSIRGNQDRVILDFLEEPSDYPTLEYVKTLLTKEITDWLKALDFDCIIDENLYCCHATPQSDSKYLSEALNDGYVGIKSIEEIDQIVKDIPQPVIACGHSHLPRNISVTGKRIINPGSVGLPAYDDDLPVYHKMENYSPAARYAILQTSGESITVNQIAVEYDHEAAAQQAEKNNRPDWAKWIRTGRV